jgi:hypothetical protein
MVYSAYRKYFSSVIFLTVGVLLNISAFINNYSNYMPIYKYFQEEKAYILYFLGLMGHIFMIVYEVVYYFYLIYLFYRKQRNEYKFKK